MRFADVKDKTIVLLLMGTDEQGKDDWVVLSGQLKSADQELKFFFEEENFIPITQEIFARIREVPLDMKKTLFNADYFIPLSVGNLPEDADSSEYEKVGYKWPSHQDNKKQK